jgi:hypothetical protein
VTFHSFQNARRSIAQFHENPKIVDWLKAQRAIVYLTAERRRTILYIGAFLAGALGLLNRNAKWKDYAEPTVWLAPVVVFPLLLGLLYLLYFAAVRLQNLPSFVRRRPQLFLHLLFWAVLSALWLTPPDASWWRPVLVLIALSLPYLLWRCGYMILSAQRGKVAGTRFRDHLFYFWPLWGGTNTPFGKGLDYLSQREAKTPEAYALSVLAGMKLVILALLWEFSKLLLGAAVFGEAKNPLLRLWGGHSLGLPRLSHIFHGQVQASLMITWLILYLELIRETLEVAAQGHGMIGLLRLFGFNVFRNTYKPLLAETIIDFWSRFYYYFKELMFEIFFFPTYLRHFRAFPKLRIFAAVFAAAFVGNTYYHIIQAKNALVGERFESLEHLVGPRLVYCFFLALGIYVSMLRQQGHGEKRETAPGGLENLVRFRRIAGVWTFFALIQLWTVRSNLSLGERAGFFFSLLGF